MLRIFIIFNQEPQFLIISSLFFFFLDVYIIVLLTQIFRICPLKSLLGYLNLEFFFFMFGYWKV